MNRIEKKLSAWNPHLLSKIKETQASVSLLLQTYSKNFPTYTDHSIEHVNQVFYLASEILTNQELENVNEDELYVLACACYLHDVGMCIPEERIEEITGSVQFANYKSLYPENSKEDFIRNIHHELSHDFILKEWQLLKIESERYAKAIALVAMGHRKVDLANTTQYEPKFFVKHGRDFVCLPFLACVLRIADELDVTNIRTPRLLTKYYMPNNNHSLREWNKHIATTQINFAEDKVIYEVNCTDQAMYAALQEQFEKIQSNINTCQKVIRSIANTEDRQYSLNLRSVQPNYKFDGFDPKGIRYSFDVQNVITAFIGDDLYGDKLVSVREALQNAIDSCRYKKTICLEGYNPEIRVYVDRDKIVIEDNGMGMDEFIIETFFGRLGSSFYEQDKIKGTFEAIGQFGVGVFSYFLIAEYVDIETKTDKSKSLRFRIDKDPKNYFHFFDCSTKSLSGTSITLHLKEEYKGLYNGSNIETYIIDTFRYIEFPIFVNYDDISNRIDARNFSIDYQRDIASRFQILMSEKESHYTSIDVSLDCSNYVGVCSITISKDKNNPFQNLNRLFDDDAFSPKYERYSNKSIVEYTQRGVLVSSYESNSLGYCIGYIDVKKKIKININRNGFSEILPAMEIMADFEIALLNKLYTIYFEQATLNQKVELTEKLLTNYISAYGLRSHFGKFRETLEKILVFEVHCNNRKEIKPLVDILKENNTFGLVFNNKNANYLMSTNYAPIAVVAHGSHNSIYQGCFMKLLHIFQYSYKMFIRFYCDSDGYGFVIFDKEEPTFSKILDRSTLTQFDRLEGAFVDSNSDYVMVRIYFEGSTDESHSESFYNIRHSFFQKFLRCIEDKKMSTTYRKIYNSIFEQINYLYERYGAFSVDLTELNELAARLELPYSYVFTQADFAKEVIEN